MTHSAGMTASGHSRVVAGEKPVFTVGLIADTHIPDRVTELHPCILPLLREAGAGHILHAGDICVASVLDTLRQVAPVTAVRGNRDMMAGPLPLHQVIELAGVKIALTHGHGGIGPYLWDKWQFWLFGYRLERYLRVVTRWSQGAKVIVFGHTHHAETVWHGEQLLVNPGSASFGFGRAAPPTIGLLRIYAGGEVQAEIRALTGFQIKNRRWVQDGA